MKRFFIVTTFIFLIIGSACNQYDRHTGESSIRISAASSLTSVMKEIKKIYEQEYPDQSVTFQYASSGTLAHQIMQGAPSNLYISANKRWMDKVVQNGQVQKQHVQPLLKNRLILATKQDEKLSLKDLNSNKIEQFAMGDPESVPAGAYTKEVLEHVGIWEDVREKAVFGKNVRQVASYIESQNVEAGFVYQSDVKALKSLDESEVIPEEYHSPILYPLGMISSSQEESMTQAFIKFLNGPKAESIFQSHGFIVISK